MHCVVVELKAFIFCIFSTVIIKQIKYSIPFDFFILLDDIVTKCCRYFKFFLVRSKWLRTHRLLIFVMIGLFDGKYLFSPGDLT